MRSFLSYHKILIEAKTARDKNGLFVKSHGAGVRRYYIDPETLILHREDGPAIEHDLDPKFNAYFLNGKRHTKDEWLVVINCKNQGFEPTKEEIKTMTGLLDI